MNKPKPKISVVICTYNRAGLLPVCLDALVSQTLDKDAYEVVIVNNNSTDNTVEIAEKYCHSQPNFRLVFEGRQGHAHARNRGWMEAHGEYIAYLDDDTRAVPGWCDGILKAFINVTPKPAAVGGKILPWYEEKPPTWFADELEVRSWGTQPGFLKPPRARHGFSGANMAFPRAILEELGGFSTDFGIVAGKLRMGEDTDLFFRLYEKSPLFWYDPEIIVFHWTPLEVTRLGFRFRRTLISGRSLAYLEKRKFYSLRYIKEWILFFLFLLKFPLGVLGSDKNFKTALILKVEELGGRLGYLFGGL